MPTTLYLAAKTATILAGGNSGRIRSQDATYATARSGGTLTTTAATLYGQVGQDFATPNYTCHETFLDFDTSGIPADATITSAVLSICGEGDSSATDFTIKVIARDWGTTLENADWIAGADLDAAGTLVAHYATVSGWASAPSFNAFIDDAMAASIVKGGHTRLVLYSDRHAAGNTPTGTEYVWTDAVNSTSAQLVISYTTGDALGSLRLGSRPAGPVQTITGETWDDGGGAGASWRATGSPTRYESGPLSAFVLSGTMSMILTAKAPRSLVTIAPTVTVYRRRGVTLTQLHPFTTGTALSAILAQITWSVYPPGGVSYVFCNGDQLVVDIAEYVVTPTGFNEAGADMQVNSASVGVGESSITLAETVTEFVYPGTTSARRGLV
jgi:hypothetical protein